MQLSAERRWKIMSGVIEFGTALLLAVAAYVTYLTKKKGGGI
jgi:hypothetical protein